MKASLEARIRMGAARLGIDAHEYGEHVRAGEKWCTRCRRWQPRSEFGPHPSRADGLSGECLESNRAAAREWQRRKRAHLAEAARP